MVGVIEFGVDIDAVLAGEEGLELLDGAVIDDDSQVLGVFG
jgi:hypothetical protein